MVKKRNMFRTGLLVALVAVAAPATLALVSAQRATPPPGSITPPSDDLWKAIVTVESGGKIDAFCPADGASGVAQIRLVCLEDTNRIAQRRGLDVRFAPEDRFIPRHAQRIFDIYLNYYGEQYFKETGRMPTDEVYARIWNGGPTGWRKASTDPYWERVRTALPAAG